MARAMFAVALLALLAVAGANKHPDPYKEGDPIHDEAFREAYLHNDGTINEKVLVKLHEFSPFASGGIPGFLGVLAFLFLFGMMIYWAMTSMKCFEPRSSVATDRLEQMRRVRNLEKIESQGV